MAAIVSGLAAGQGAEIADRRSAARRRLEARAGLTGEPTVHFRRATERPFTAAERDRVTILFGGLTGIHERLIRAVFNDCGYAAQPLPEADLAACHVGKQYCNNGVCNPAYFTVGSLIRYLQHLEASGLSRQEIEDRYVFFTAGSCGPCRFGMYEAEYRLALRNAGFEHFRVLLFRQSDGVKADTGEPGLKLSLRLGLGAVNAFTIGDALQAFAYGARPFESTPGATDDKVKAALEVVAASLASHGPVRAADVAPPWALGLVGERQVTRWATVQSYLFGAGTRGAIAAAAARLSEIEVDRLRVKPVVKITGEFWAQSTEGDGNFRMFSFLEREGAHVLVEPLSGWVMYLLQHLRARVPQRRGLAVPRHAPLGVRLVERVRDERRLATRALLVNAGEWLYRRLYDRARAAFGVPHELLDQEELATLAAPYYHQLARGGEGHLEVAKNIYYTTRRAAHMVLSLKPFGCMPSTQSDGVQSAILARFRDMSFLPIETGADGELAAHSRVQMALVEARVRAQAEFDRALARSGRSVEEIRRYVDTRPHLRKATYHVPHQPGVAGAAATFVLHVAELMRRDREPGRVHQPIAAREAAGS